MADTQFPIGQRINLPGHFPEPVVLESVRPIGDGFECRVRLSDGTPDETILSRQEADTLLGQRVETAKSLAPISAEKFRLLVESARIRLAYAHDKHFAVSLSGIRTRPLHQRRRLGRGAGDRISRARFKNQSRLGLGRRDVADVSRAEDRQPGARRRHVAGRELRASGLNSIRPLKKAHLLRCARSPRSNVLYKYASAEPVLSEPKDRFLARLASETFLTGLETEFFNALSMSRLFCFIL